MKTIILNKSPHLAVVVVEDRALLQFRTEQGLFCEELLASLNESIPQVHECLVQWQSEFVEKHRDKVKTVVVPLEPRNCRKCGTMFIPNRKWQEFCSKECQVTNWLNTVEQRKQLSQVQELDSTSMNQAGIEDAIKKELSEETKIQ